MKSQLGYKKGGLHVFLDKLTNIEKFWPSKELMCNGANKHPEISSRYENISVVK